MNGSHAPWQCRPETCGGIDYDPCVAARHPALAAANDAWVAEVIPVPDLNAAEHGHLFPPDLTRPIPPEVTP